MTAIKSIAAAMLIVGFPFAGTSTARADEKSYDHAMHSVALLSL
jgi:hypothetical protein